MPLLFLVYRAHDDMTQRVLDGILKSGLSHHQGGSAASVHLYTPALYRCTVAVTGAAVTIAVCRTPEGVEHPVTVRGCLHMVIVTSGQLLRRDIKLSKLLASLLAFIISDI